ncbi:MAG: nucleotidyltransferase domain-containing protein [Saprospiraceae bacterium]|nr:nucleotidyltransferase domain-containing protein [Saprospiraceae bacterium]
MPEEAIHNIDFDSGQLSYLKPFALSLKAVCKKYGVEKLYVFGSLATGEFDLEKSDVDFLVRFKQDEKVGISFLSMMIELEKLLNRKVDLIRERPFENEYFARSVAATKTLIYAA